LFCFVGLSAWSIRSALGSQHKQINLFLQNFWKLCFLWSSGQSSWLTIRRPGFDSRHYQILPFPPKKRKTVVGLERGPLSLVSTTGELLDRKIAAPV
jgi:hypothetical protein